VFDLIQQSQAGSMPAGNYYGEVGLASFHDFDSMVPDDVKSMLVDMAAALKSGTLLACVWQDCPTEIATDYGVTDDTIRVGAIADLSGPFSPLVKFIVDAQQVYWDMVNRDGGIAGRQVEFVVRDSGYKIDAQLEHYEEFTEESDNGVVMISQSTGTPMTVAIAETAIEDNMAVIPLSWYSGWPDPEFGKNIFESTSNYCYEAINGVDFLNEHVAAQTGIAAPTMAIIGMAGDYGQDGSAGAWIAAEALGIEVVADLEGTVAPGADNTGALSELVAAGADMVWTTVSPSILAELVGGAAAQGYIPWWSGNVPSYNPALLDSAVGPVLDTNYILNSYILTWNTPDVPGLEKMKEEMLLAMPDAPLSDTYIQGWVEGQAAHQALVRAAANGDLTRAGVVAAFNQITVDHEGLAPDQSWGGAGDPNDTVVRESYSFDIVLDNYTSGATIAEGGDTGSVLLRGPWVSEITAAQVYEGACWLAE
jgi:ABC-type branched-subunit amino acid transport system substrate-binding protein